MSVEDNKLIVRRFIEEAINKGNVDGSGDYIAEDVVELVPFPGQGPGLSGLKDVLKGLRVAFPDMHWTIEEQIAEADKVMTRFVWTGTQRYIFWGSCHGDARNGWGMVIDEHGKVKETRFDGRSRTNETAGERSSLQRVSHTVVTTVPSKYTNSFCEQTFRPQPVTSGLPRTTDINRPARLVRLVPQADSRTAANGILIRSHRRRGRAASPAR